MDFNTNYFQDLAADLLTTPSPTGFTDSVIHKLEAYASQLGLMSQRTKKGNLVIDFPGIDPSRTVGLSAHVDTLGLMIRSIASDGSLNITTIGGNQPMTLQGEYCTVHNRAGQTFTGTILSKAPSSHVYEANKSKGQTFDELMVRLDEQVKTKQDVLDFGINNGDFISIDPKTTFTPSGFIKSRHLDDKISAASILTLFKWMLDSGEKPAFNVKLVLSVYEEVGHGAAHLPDGLDSFIAVDMGCIGADLSCTEYDVSICAKDSSGPYDYSLTSKLISLAKEGNIKHAVDIYPFYGSDASAAMRAGHDIPTALIGPGVYASHGVERTHISACEQTMKLLHAYLTQ